MKAENIKSNVVVNLSSKPLNSAESSLLSKGLHFCPNPPKINVCELVELIGVLGLIPSLLNLASRFFENVVPLVLTYHPSLEKIAGIVRHDWKGMEKSVS
jgi:hypothetical protein